ncbi:MAG: phosphoribosylglycinamide formyltransferase [Candidatus Omnitrophica bacterium]|nr:phosphoribosylglycinamide formyltransferase [Candidatus Omnitrophota bacterium]
MNFAVFASGNGSNLQMIIDAVKKKRIKGTLKLVFSDNAAAFALTRARKAKVPVVAHLDPKGFPSREAFDAACVEFLKKEKIDLVVLAGYMRILSPAFVRAYRDRILNIHPALLPAFKGAHAIKDAFEHGVKVTGVTVHLVDEEVDHGMILAQVPVEVSPKDTRQSLEARIHKAEHILYPKVIALFTAGKIKTKGPAGAV